jgi:hypothetical protein
MLGHGEMCRECSPEGERYTSEATGRALLDHNPGVAHHFLQIPVHLS